MVTVSVVVPTYNRAGIVGRAIDSALTQTYEDLEVIVVDDASTDDTGAVVGEYGPRVRYYRHDENRGGSAARNTGIDHAEGEFVAFLDSDDEWHPGKVAAQLECLGSRSNEWGGVYCDFRQARSSPVGTVLDGLFSRPSGQEGGESLLRDLLLLEFDHGGASTLLVRRDVLVELDGFDESFDRQQDWEFLGRLLRRWKLAYVDRCLVTKHDTGLPDLDVVRRSRRQYLRKFAREVVDLSFDGHAVVGRHRFALAKIAFANGEFETGLSYLRRSSIPTTRDVIGLVRSAYLGWTRS